MTICTQNGSALFEPGYFQNRRLKKGVPLR